MNTEYKTRAWHIIKALSYAAGSFTVRKRGEGAEVYLPTKCSAQQAIWEVEMRAAGAAAMAPKGDPRLTIKDPEAYRASNEGFEYEAVFAH